jgi:endoglycosylceramidase
MHGFDIVHKKSPYYPNNFTSQDASFLADEGFTVARIGFIWAGVEPEPGVYDNAYIEQMVRFNQLLSRYGIHTLIDFHQDAWSSLTGGDGAPAWATPDHTNFLNDFQDFWDNAPGPNGVGIQTAFDDAWRHVVQMLDASPAAGNIVGFDPFNEPYAGTSSGCAPFTPCPGFESGELAGFYRGVIAAIRSTGDHHVIFPEGIAQNGIAEPSLPKFADPQTAFSFHYYCPLTQTATSTEPDDSLCTPLRDRGVGNFVTYANDLDLPAFEGEFSCNDDDRDNAATVDLFDQDLLSWTIWAYYTYASDPANCAGQGLLIDDDKPGSVANAKPAKLAALVVPYPDAIAGTPESYGFDRSTDTMSFAYSTSPAGGAKLAHGAETVIFAPRLVYPTGYAVRMSGARVTSAPTSPWVELLAGNGAQSVTVTISPRTGSSTLLPSQTHLFPYSRTDPSAFAPPARSRRRRARSRTHRPAQ